MFCSRDSPIYFLAIVALTIAFAFFLILIVAVASIVYLLSHEKGHELINALSNVTSSMEASCSLDFCAAHDMERTFDRHALLQSYIGCAVLAILYIVWERSPIHRFVTTEAVYKAIVIILLYLASTFWEQSTTKLAIISGAIAIRSTTFALVAAYLVMSYADIDTDIPDFFARPSTRRFARPKRDKLPPRGVRFATQLNERMLEVVGSDQTLSGGSFATIIFLLFLLEELGLAFPNYLSGILSDASMILELVILYGIIRWALWVLFKRRRDISEIRKMVRTLRSKDADGFRYMLEHVSVGTLINLGGTEVQDILRESLEEGMLDNLSKAIIIDAFQKTGLHGFREQCEVRDLLLSCHGNDLVYVKTLLDGSGGYHNLSKLIFDDVSFRSVRDEILAHFAAEAEQLRTVHSGRVGVKVLSDVDDTLLSSAGHFPAGCDQSYPHKVVYPGCLKLYECLDATFSPGQPSCNLVFLSARPHVFKDLAEEASYQVFNSLVSSSSMHSIPTLLAGKLLSGIWATLTFKCIGVRAWKPVGQDKYSTYTKYIKLYPEYDFVFCGDDGQGDLFAGQHMLEDDSGLCRAVVIHRVLEGTPLHEPFAGGSDSSDDDDEEGLLRKSPARLIFHKSYVGAALDIHRADPQLLPIEKVAEVANSAISDLESIMQTWPKWYSSSHGLAADQDLRACLARAESLLGPTFKFNMPSREEYQMAMCGSSDDES
eukprot:TRINITY_DN92051_c0_g1_i1.p1 TRINITY_DN92051_c0_g1~~TRINITY_DN92051_c0_g1_i1.p1  ORF type:complete len:715 (+),score=108.01 TRINITY_DN92051_c0_g1_i1:25-2169(+)